MSEMKGDPEEIQQRLLELEVLYQTAPVGLAFLDDELRYVRINQGLAEMNGLPIEAHIGRHAGEINPELGKVLVPMMEQVLASRQPLRDVEIKSAAPDEVPDGRTWTTSIQPVAMGAASGLSVAFQNVKVTKEDEGMRITRQLRAHAALLRCREEVRQFAFAAANDLQEPLRNLGIFHQLLDAQGNGEGAAEISEQLSIVVESARRMQTLLTDLLEYAKAAEVHGEPGLLVDCNEVCQAALDSMASEIASCQADVSFAHLPAIVVERGHLLRLFQSLIGNALKYRAKERRARIHVSAERRGAHWVFSVADNGIGIAPEYHERIFGLFKRLHGRDVPGTGMGLAICKLIADHYGGRLWLESEAGVGSTFYFTLPQCA